MGTKVVNITITRKTAAVTRAGFGIPLIIGQHSQPDLLYEFAEVDEMADAGFNIEGADKSIYDECVYAMSQSPSPVRFKVGKLPNPVGARTGSFTPSVDNAGDANVGQSVGMTIGETVIAYVIQAGDGAAEISAGLALAITTGGVSVTAADNSPSVDMIGDAGSSFVVTLPVNGLFAVAAVNPVMTSLLTPSLTNAGDADVNKVVSVDIDGATASYTIIAGDDDDAIAVGMTLALDALAGAPVDAVASAGTVKINANSSTERFAATNPVNCTVKETTTTQGIASALSAIKDLDNDWYGIGTTLRSSADLVEVATWTETQNRICSLTTHDSDAWDNAETGDVLSLLKALGFVRTNVQVQPLAPYGDGSAILGLMLTTTPGSATWAHQSLAGVPVSNFSESELTTIENKGGNYYRDLGGSGATFQGISPGGEWMDTMRLVDWTEARMTEGVMQVLKANPKVPYSNPGVELIKTPIRSVLQTGVANGGHLAEPPYSVTAPDVADISTNDKANRILPDVKFLAYLAGAIHTVIIKGVVSL